VNIIGIIDAVISLRPGSQWELRGDTYDGLVWKEPPVWEGGQKKPTKEEVEAEVARLQAEYDAKEYQRQRVPEYPSIGDQLDAIWKGGDAYDAMLAKVMAIKDKYPKPE
jgi:hypothetical protein